MNTPVNLIKITALASFASVGFLLVLSGVVSAQTAPSPSGCSCKNAGGDDDVAETPITANLADSVKAEVTSAFNGLAADSQSQMDKLDQALAAFEGENSSKAGWDPRKFLDLKNSLTQQLRDKLQNASTDVTSSIKKLGEDIASDIEKKINEASPKVLGLAEYEHCLDPCEFQNGTPGWKHVDKLYFDGVVRFSGSGSATIGPVDLEISGSIPGFAELKVSGKISGTLSGSISGEFTPGQPTSIKPKNKPAAKATCMINFPLTGSAKVEARTLLVGASGELTITINKVIGPLDLEYEAEDNCGSHP